MGIGRVMELEEVVSVALEWGFADETLGIERMSVTIKEIENGNITSVVYYIFTIIILFDILYKII